MYRIYKVNSEDITVNFSELGFDDIKNLAVDFEESDSLETFLHMLINDINNDLVDNSNQFYYLVDETNGIVLTY